MRADFVGPVFSKVYTPNNFLADRLKHVIEPAFSVQRITAIDGEDRIVLLGSSYDRVVGGVTRMTYGLTNRVLVRKAPKDAERLGARQRAARAAHGQHHADLLHRPARQQLRPDLLVELRRHRRRPRAEQLLADVAAGAHAAHAVRRRLGAHGVRLHVEEDAVAVVWRRLHHAHHAGQAGLEQEPVVVLSDQLGQRIDAAQPAGRAPGRRLLDQLGHRARRRDSAARGRLLQRPVLRHHRGIPAVQPRRLQRHVRFLRTGASTWASRWPASARSRTSSGTWAGETTSVAAGSRARHRRRRIRGPAPAARAHAGGPGRGLVPARHRPPRDAPV